MTTQTPELQPSPDWDMVELRWAGTYLDGRPAQGRIVVTYNGTQPLLDDGAPPVAVYPVRLEMPLTTTTIDIGGQSRQVGYASVRVPASNDPDIVGSGGSYSFTEALTEGKGRNGVNFVADKDAPGGVIWINKLPGGLPSTPQTPFGVVYWADVLSAPATLTNKRITRRVHTVATAATYVLDSDLYDGAVITAQAGPLTIAAPTGAPTQMQSVIWRVRDNGFARPITFDPALKAVGVDLPTSTVPGKQLYVGAMWNADDSRYDIVAVGPEA